MNAAEEKNRLRRIMRQRLRTLPADWRENAAAALCEHLLASPLPGAAAAMVGYLHIQQEPALETLFHQWLSLPGRKLFLPRFNAADGSYDLAAVTSITGDCRPGKFGIPEPCAELPAAETLPSSTLWLIPGLAFSRRSGVRLGRGGGYYDRLLQRFPHAVTVGIAWENQLLDDLPQEVHDFRMQYIATPDHLYPVDRSEPPSSNE